MLGFFSLALAKFLSKISKILFRLPSALPPVRPPLREYFFMMGLCWPILAHLGTMFAYLGSMLAYLGPMLAHLGPMLAHLGPSWPQFGFNLLQLGSSWPQLGSKSTKHDLRNCPSFCPRTKSKHKDLCQITHVGPILVPNSGTGKSIFGVSSAQDTPELNSNGDPEL